MLLFEEIAEEKKREKAQAAREATLAWQLKTLLEKFKASEASGTPDEALAEYLLGTLGLYNQAVYMRELSHCEVNTPASYTNVKE